MKPTLSLLLMLASGSSACNLDTRSLICSSVILDELDCLDRDLLLDIFFSDGICSLVWVESETS